MRLKDVIISGDTLAAFGIWLVCQMFLPERIANSAASSIYSVGISVLSIVFSVFFAALAIILSASDDSFVTFLEETGDYTGLVRTFRFTLWALFGALSLAIISYVSATVLPVTDLQPLWRIKLFASASTYALTATFLATLDATQYCLMRAKFLRWKPKSDVASPLAAGIIAPSLGAHPPVAPERPVAPQQKSKTRHRRG